jgi:hypothetical protein
MDIAIEVHHQFVIVFVTDDQARSPRGAPPSRLPPDVSRLKIVTGNDGIDTGGISEYIILET